MELRLPLERAETVIPGESSIPSQYRVIRDADHDEVAWLPDWAVKAARKYDLCVRGHGASGDYEMCDGGYAAAESGELDTLYLDWAQKVESLLKELEG